MTFFLITSADQNAVFTFYLWWAQTDEECLSAKEAIEAIEAIEAVEVMVIYCVAYQAERLFQSCFLKFWPYVYIVSIQERDFLCVEMTKKKTFKQDTS